MNNPLSTYAAAISAWFFHLVSVTVPTLADLANAATALAGLAAAISTALQIYEYFRKKRNP